MQLDSAMNTMVQQLAHSKKEVSDLTKYLVDIHEDDMRYVAQELHDEAGQELAILGFLLDRAIIEIRNGQFPNLQKARAQVTEIGTKIRNISNKLYPPELENQNLTPALLALILKYTDSTGIHVAFEQYGLERILPRDVTIAVYRIMREALTNVARHAGVKDVSVRIHASANLIHFEIEDRGVGFDPEKTVPGIGIKGMNYRVILLRGTLKIESHSGKGTCISGDIPIS
jgi:two-component system NarL family sensor kinase